MEQTNKWKKGLQWPHTAWLFFFFFNVFIYLSVFMLLSDAKRDVLRFATGAFACAAARSEPLESDWKDLFPALFNYVPLDAEARLPSKEGEKERRGRRGQRSTVTTRREPFWRSAPRPLTLKRVFRSSERSTRGCQIFPAPWYIQPDEV